MCPPLKDWQAILPSPTMAPVEEPSPSLPTPSLPDPVTQLITKASTLYDQGQPYQALNEYRSALERLPAHDPRVGEVMQTIDTLERQLSQSTITKQRSDLNVAVPVVIGVIIVILLVWASAIGLNRVPPSDLVVTSPTAVVEPATPPVTPSPTPTMTPSPLPSPSPVLAFRVDRIMPTELFIGAIPLEFTVQGAGLSTVRTATLRAAGYEPIALTIIAGSSDSELRLRLANLKTSLAGAIPFTLELNGTPVPGAAVTLRDFVSIRTVAGVRAEYRYTGRIEEDGQGLFSRLYAEPVATSSLTDPIRNGDEVEVLSDQPAGWYRIRIRTSSDQNLAGRSGYIERWLIDNIDVPPPPTPTVPPEPPRLRFRKLSETEDSRCVLIQIRGVDTSGWSVSVDGLRLGAVFDASGDARICGLRPRQEVTFTVRDEQGAPVRGGVGVPTRGNDVMFAEWR
jgi:hypothetical protein